MKENNFKYNSILWQDLNRDEMIKRAEKYFKEEEQKLTYINN